MDLIHRDGISWMILMGFIYTYTLGLFQVWNMDIILMMNGNGYESGSELDGVCAVVLMV